MTHSRYSQRITPAIFRKIKKRLPDQIHGGVVFFGNTIRVKIDWETGQLNMVRSSHGFAKQIREILLAKKYGINPDNWPEPEKVVN
jgi:hypothetical protein